MKNFLSASLLFFLIAPVLKAQSTGTLRLNLDIESYFLIVDEDYQNPYEMGKLDSVRVDTGLHQFRLVQPFQNDRIFREKIISGETVARNFFYSNYQYPPDFSSYPLLFWDSNLMIFSEPEGRIFIDGNEKGTSNVALSLPEEEYELKVQNGKYTNSGRVSVAENYFQAITLSTLPIKKTAQRYSFVPGLSQFYKGDTYRGIGFSVGFAVMSVSSIIFHSNFIKADNNFKMYESLYNQTHDPHELLVYGDKAEAYLKDSQKYYDKRNTALIVSGIIYAISLTDALLMKPKRGYFQGWDFNPYTDFGAKETLLGISIRKRL
ncbi:MAG: DUF5683 domain-containing protein [Balneolaceae bacterium]